MEKKNGRGPGRLTVKHKQMAFCFAHSEPCYRRTISYAVENDREFTTSQDCAHSALGYT